MAMYHDGNRELQTRFGSRALADRLVERLWRDRFKDEDKTFIESVGFFFLATADASGRPDCSFKGGPAGFVQVPQPDLLVFPDYDGNGMFLSLGNMVVNPAVGLLFLDFEGGTRLRVNGVASVLLDDPLIGTFAGAQAVVRVAVTAAFPNCRRYVHPRQRVDRSPFVPTAGAEPPVPDWKLDPWFDGALAAGDPANEPGHPSAPAMPEF